MQAASHAINLQSDLLAPSRNLPWPQNLLHSSQANEQAVEPGRGTRAPRVCTHLTASTSSSSQTAENTPPREASEHSPSPVPNPAQPTTTPRGAGRVKTLHPAVHGGILARRDTPAHLSAIAEHSIAPIDVVVVNLYPFRATVTQTPPPAFADGVENIDIGGPAMIRAAAKNHGDVTVCVDPSDYGQLLESLGGAQSEGLAFRKTCAWKAFQVRLLSPRLRSPPP